MNPSKKPRIFPSGPANTKVGKDRIFKASVRAGSFFALILRGIQFSIIA